MNLAKWFRYMQMHPWHSMQLATSGSNSLIPIQSQCNGLVYEYAWQFADGAGRSEVRQAITYAQSQWNEWARFPATPTFKTATLPYPRLANKALTRFIAADLQGDWLPLILPDGKVTNIGYEHITTASSTPVVYSDDDGDGLFETATITATVPAGTQTSELYLTFLAADVLYPDTPPIPIRQASIVGTTATISVDTYNLVRPILYTLPRPTALDPTILPPAATSPFATDINVARRFCDPTGTTIDTAQAVLIWESTPVPPWAFFPVGSVTPDPAALAYAVARVGIRDGQAGVVYLGQGVYDSTNGTWSGRVDFSNCRPPDRVLIRYQAGIESPQVDMAIAQLSAANLARRICACQPSNKELSEWQTDLSRTGATNELYASPDDISNPLGSRRGHVYAWRTIQKMMSTPGILV